ncbi:MULTISPECIES: hypothetical protein [Serratia]|uniref:hypothetical protein n=1 Tax=Serratia TaxID=613 RepID=UPI0018D7C60C|nr:hypothetical protein [Serratia marcescens]
MIIGVRQRGLGTVDQQPHAGFEQRVCALILQSFFYLLVPPLLARSRERDAA